MSLEIGIYDANNLVFKCIFFTEVYFLDGTETAKNLKIGLCYLKLDNKDLEKSYAHKYEVTVNI